MKDFYKLSFFLVYCMQFLNLHASEIVNKIAVIGNDRIPTATIMYYANFKIGTKITQNDINVAMKKLYSQGFFTDISITHISKNILNIRVEENAVVGNIFIQGNKKIKDTILKADLQIKKGNTYSRFQIDSDIKRIEASYKKAGYFEVSVHFFPKKRRTNIIDITIIVNEGQKSKIKKIAFYGNTHFLQKDLLCAIASREISWNRYFASDSLYNQNRLVLDKELLHEYYVQKGYINFKILASNVEILRNTQSFFLTYIISEGQKFNFGKLSIDCKIQGIKTSNLAQHIECREGAVFNKNLIANSIDKMANFITHKGHTSFEIDYQLNKNDTNGTVNIKFIINKTPTLLVKDINIIGNARTIDRIIRRELTIYERDSLDLSKIQRSKKRIVNLGYFNAVEIENNQTLKKNKLNLDIKIQETATGSVKFAIGYNGASGIIGSATLAEYNFLGNGQIIELDVNKTKKNLSASFSFTEPRVADRNLSVGFDIFTVSQNKVNRNLLHFQNGGVSFKFGYSINEYLHHNLHYSIKNEKYNGHYYTYISMTQPINSIMHLVTHSIMYDKLNNRTNPTMGYVIKLNQNFMGTNREISYLHNQLYAGFYQSLYKENVILHLIGRVNNVKAINNPNIHVANNLFIGEEYIRGFDISGVGPRIKKYQDSLGGKNSLTGTAEISFPISIIKHGRMKGVLFTDFGTLLETDAGKYKCKDTRCICNNHNKIDVNIGSKPLCNNKKLNFEYINDSKRIRASYGIGLIWQSPFGLVKLDYGIPYKNESFDDISRIRFSIGTNF